MRKNIRSIAVSCVVLAVSCLVMAGGCWGDATSDYNQAMELYNDGKYADAIEVLERVVSSDAQLACSAQHQIGTCYYVTGKLDDAIPAYQNALSLAQAQRSELTFDIMTTLAYVYMKARLWNEASSVIQQIALVDAEEGGHMLFMSWEDQRDFERAAAALIYSLVATPGIEHIGSNGLPTWLLSSSDRTPVSNYVKSFCDAVANGATITATSQIRADLQAMLEKCKQTDGAAAVVLAGFSELDVASERASKLYELGSVYYRGGKYQQAVPVFEDALKLGSALSEKGQMSAGYLLGVCHCKLKDMDTAKSYMNDIVTRYPDSKNAKWAKAYLASWAKTPAGSE